MTDNLKDSLVNMILAKAEVKNVEKLREELESFNVTQLTFILSDVDKYIIAY
jgi:hypothetical protein